MPPSRHAHTIDSLRGLAAVGVAVFHFSLNADKLGLKMPWADAGTTGVQLFFVLSGFLIGKTVLSPRFHWRDYALNRVFRIVPNYYFSILLMLALMQPAILVAKGGVGNLLTHLTFLHGWFPEYVLQISGVYWTLTNEFFFYLLMLLIAPIFRHRAGGWWLTVALIAGSVGYKWLLFRMYGKDLQGCHFLLHLLPGCLDLFGCGMLVALAGGSAGFQSFVQRPVVKWSGLILSSGAVVWLLSVFLSHPRILGTHLGNQTMQVFWPLGFAAACAGLILFLERCEVELGGLLQRCGLSFLGMISYSIYLWHTTVLRAFGPILGRKDRPETWLLMVWIAASILLVSVAMYFLVEKPFLEMRRRQRAVVA